MRSVDALRRRQHCPRWIIADRQVGAAIWPVRNIPHGAGATNAAGYGGGVG